eukprot:11724609-Alexandrium_andersonii.AAC.1
MPVAGRLLLAELPSLCASKSSTSSGDRERFVATAWNSDRDVARLSRDVGDMDRPTGQVDFKEGNAH